LENVRIYNKLGKPRAGKIKNHTVNNS